MVPAQDTPAQALRAEHTAEGKVRDDRMANYREHISVSGMLGFGYGLASTALLEFTPVQGILAGCLTTVGGMLPDLDSPNARPIREVISVVSAIAPLLLVHRVAAALGGWNDPESIILLIVVMHLTIKYAVPRLIARLSVHRGMFHSLPALGIAAEAVYLAHPNPDPRVRFLMACGIGTGFLSHLLLDELYSVHVKDARIRLKRSSGTAMKLTGDRFFPNVFTWSLLATLSYIVLADIGWLEQEAARPHRPLSEQAAPLSEQADPDVAPEEEPDDLPVVPQTAELASPADAPQ